jgi:hypothetical protein
MSAVLILTIAVALLCVAVTPDLSESYPSPISIDDHAAVENLTAVARMAAGLHLPTGPSQVVALLPPPGGDKGLST